ncbi:uncharacterized protein AB675_1322 [Cyphellophora attinorum]|uniref:CCAAT-binding factor domain-containing protein n=1 Tax=Cyphellophora attinorum TaxID=1664694 RepID=A0A0N1H227_9EURO|nr:uncharacterized protein AB675_1322 [Phialophora attinorum]KPI35137.1 hypothetical protein AB675_1322 [Phialophora attinorum]
MSKRKHEDGQRSSVGNAPAVQQPQRGQPASQSFEQLQHKIESNLKPKSQKKHNAGQMDSDRQRRGKKRDASGKVIGAIDAAVAKPQQSGRSAEDEFLAEVQALGGTREDLMFLADIESDSEMEGDVEKSTAARRGTEDLEKGMKNILKEIALAQGTADQTEDAGENAADTGSESGGAATEDEEPASEEDDAQPVPTTVEADEVGTGWFVVTDAFNKLEPKRQARQQTVQELREHAKTLLEKENEQFKKRGQSSSQSFYNTVIQSGTLSDKISALTLAVQESPIHNMKALETLLGLASKRSRSQAVDVLRALKDLFAQGVQDEHLVAWAYEDWLKEKYFEILKILEVWCNDEIEFAKSKAVSYVYEMLREKPEQESNLLRLLINKLGDPVKKIASQSSYLLLQLLKDHPNMKDVVVSAIEADFIFRPGQSLHGKYYATITLNQTELKEEDLALKLLNIYFGLFSDLMKTAESEEQAKVSSVSREQRRRQARKKQAAPGQPQTEELREKLTSALLTGVNRAHPYCGSDNKIFDEHLDTLYKIAHSANFNTGIQAMLLIQQLSSAQQSSSDRFYKVLYESLLDQRLITASKQQLYLNLLHKSLKADLSTKRVKAFVKRILQILNLHEPPFVCGAFFLLKDLDSTFPGLVALTNQPEIIDDEEEVFKDVDEDRAPTRKEPSLVSASKYDGHKRAPEHANADASCAWELLPFLAHYHPAVTINADHYLQHEALPGKPDLTLHTLMHFLDRFVYKNAKLSESRPRGSSIMQPMVNDSRNGVLIAPRIGGKERLPVTSDEFRSQQLKNVAAEDVFFHKYFAEAGKPVNKAKADSAAYDEEMVSDDEDAVWDAMMKSAPDLEGMEGDDDSDLSMSDLESAMASSDEGSGGDAGDLSDDEGVDVEAGILDDSAEETEADGSDGEMPDFAAVDSDEELEDEEPVEEASVPADEGKARKKGKKLKKALPTFASAEDYAKMLDDDEGEDYGQ